METFLYFFIKKASTTLYAFFMIVHANVPESRLPMHQFSLVTFVRWYDYFI